MAKITKPVRFSDFYSVEAGLLDKAGVLNPTLNVDTGLFIDPLLLERSRHREMREGARNTYDTHFTTVIKLLRAAKTPGDVPWRNASRLLSFPEIKWTCLGYGAASVSGSGSGNDMTLQVIETAKAIVDLGVEDPDLFVAMALFEEGFGPDRISDMATNVILGDLLAFNDKILPALNVPRKALTLRLRNGRTFNASLPVNPFIKGDSPVVLVPADILRDLPVAKDWSDVADAASQSEELRNRVNDQIANLWSAKTLKDKEAVKEWAMSDAEKFTTLLDMLSAAKGQPYDMEGDPKGELFWRKIAETLATDEPFSIAAPPRCDLEGVTATVEQILKQFQFLIEERRLSEDLYHEGEIRREKAAQRMFFAVAYAYCKANNLDITPEADTGNGPVDFKVASGFKGRVLVEIKLSSNTKHLRGYDRQLETYKTAEETVKGFYVVIDVGKMGKKAKALRTM